jgi:hypothetical protein
MAMDQTLFALLNGLAGRWPWVDALGRAVAVFGPLAGGYLLLAVVCWPRLSGELRRRYLCSLGLAAGGCLVLAGLEAGLVHLVLHHEMRARPANALWTTALLTAPTHLAFPAWPVVVLWALGAPTARVAPRAGLGLGVLGVLVGVALVFTGVNFPSDIVTGILLGATLGESALVVAGGQASRRSGGGRVAWLWGSLLLWGGVLAITLRPASDLPVAEAVDATIPGVQVSVPATLPARLQAVAGAGTTRIEAATNGHLRVLAVEVVLPSPTPTRGDVEALVRRMYAAIWAGKLCDLATVTVVGEFARSGQTRRGTLYTATLAREQWPQTGVPARLPGFKFYHPSWVATEP